LLIYSCSCTLTFCAVEKGEKIREKRLRPTGSLAQAGVLPRVTLRRILEVQLPSEPYRYPRLPQAAKTLAEMPESAYQVESELKKYICEM